MNGAKILLVEDNPLTRKIVRKVVTREGWSLIEACDGASALALLAEHHPDLILQDFVLPDVGGVELAEKLRAHPSTVGTPILAFTGFLSKNDEERASAFDGLISKPIEPSHLVHLVRGHLPSDRSRRTIDGRGRRLIVADDNATQLKLARFRLSRLGFEVETACDGVEAMAAARRKRPDVVVTDALMPGLDGFGLCRAMRDDPKLADVPIVLVTSSYVETADRDLARRTGANAFVVRTADLAGVIAALDTVLDAKTTIPAPPPDEVPSDTWESVRSGRALQQLERQVSVNNGLIQRCSTLAAELSVLSTVADALVNARNVQSALFEILANCLDVAGTSRGAICARLRDGSFAVHAQQGFTPEAATELALELERAPTNAKAQEAWVDLATVIGAKSVDALGLGSGALLLPLNARGESYGFLVLDAPLDAGEDWRAFAAAIGTQVSLALSLARAFDEVAASEQRSRALMENAVDAIFVRKEDGTLVEANHAAERLLGLPSSEIIGRSYEDFVPDDERKDTTRRHLLRQGVKVPVESSITTVTVNGERLTLAIVRDVSERNALAEQLRQSQKMEAVGKLAGGVAHDFNNLLSVILSYSEVLLGDMAPDAPIRADIEEIFDAGKRATDLTKQLLMFSRQQVMEPRVLDINDVVTGLNKMLVRIMSEQIELVLKLAPSLGHVRIDPGSMDQVIMNLVINARDAMSGGGRVKIETTNVSNAKGRFVVLAVSDTGCGMDTATRARIFEPFYTTKPTGKGTGLGLSTVFGIVEQSGGTITVASEVGKGTVFVITLPCVDDDVETLPKVVATARQGTETILLVEDEDQVRTVTLAILRRQGYRVLEARDARHALSVCEATPDTIHLLLTDVVMPQMSGPELAKRLAIARPGMKVLCMSGYTDDNIVRHGVSEGEIEFLQKPITPTLLARRVREVLDATA